MRRQAEATSMLRRTILVAVAGLLVAAVAPALGADAPSANDTARFLAGLPPADDSPLAPLAKDRSWQQHAGIFNAAFERAEKSQLSRIRAWSSANIPSARPTVF